MAKETAVDPIAALEARVAALEAVLAKLVPPAPIVTAEPDAVPGPGFKIHPPEKGA